jgi:hypothetical protein
VTALERRFIASLANRYGVSWGIKEVQQCWPGSQRPPSLEKTAKPVFALKASPVGNLTDPGQARRLSPFSHAYMINLHRTD